MAKQSKYNAKILSELKKKEMTQKQLAKEVGISYIALYSILHRGSIPKTGTAIRIANVFNLKVEELFGVD